MQSRIREKGITVGNMSPGPLNKISDVAGVTVGHYTIHEDDLNTGVTVILPAQDNVFRDKCVAAAHVHNGFGKTTGLVQINELGTLETPIALTNTLNVGLVQDALVDFTLGCCTLDETPCTSVNPVVGECNDSRLSRIALRPVTREHVISAISTASADYEEGSVGAGSGTICYGLKGGIGSASRTFELFGSRYTLGVLVQSNFGAASDLTITGLPVGQQIAGVLRSQNLHTEESDKGSVMVILATDLPISDRQLYRIIRRCGVGLARTGSYIGHGSGEIMIGFTTANRIEYAADTLRSMQLLPEEMLELPFRAAAEATEEAVLNSLICAETTLGPDGYRAFSLSEFL